MIVRTLIGPSNEEYLQLIAVTVQNSTIHFEKCFKMKVVPKKRERCSLLAEQLGSDQFSAYMSLLQIGGTKKDLLSCSHLGTLTGFLIGLSIVEGKRQEKHLKQSSTSLVANFQNNI